MEMYKTFNLPKWKDKCDCSQNCGKCRNFKNWFFDTYVSLNIILWTSAKNLLTKIQKIYLPKKIVYSPCLTKSKFIPKEIVANFDHFPMAKFA